jgi:plastocyanin
MNTTVQRGILSRMPLAPLGWLTVGSLVGIALGFWVLLMLIGTTIVAIAIVGVAALIVAGLVLTGVRWMPVVGAFFGAGTWIGGLTTQPYSLYHLTHPHEGLPFIVSVLIYVLAIVAMVAGISATVQNYRTDVGAINVAPSPATEAGKGGSDAAISVGRKMPRWMGIFLSVLIGFVLGATFISLLPESAPQSATASEPGTVHMGIAAFNQQSVTIPKGSMLRLVDDGNFPHIIANGIWDGSTPKPASEPGAPGVKDLQVTGGSLVIGPFNTAGTFSLYCTIHTGMMLKVIVQ